MKNYKNEGQSEFNYLFRSFLIFQLDLKVEFLRKVDLTQFKMLNLKFQKIT